jgi:hypothetical protein
LADQEEDDMKASPFTAAFAGLFLMVGAAAAQGLNGPNVAPPAVTPVAPGVVQAFPGGVAGGDWNGFAVINADGSIARGSGLVSASHLTTGAYQIVFNHNITLCVFDATAGLSTFSGSIPATIVTVVGRAGTNNGVFLETFNTSGTPTDQGFHLYVKCG